MVTRRRFGEIALLLCAGVPAIASAQPSRSLKRVGVLAPGNAQSDAPRADRDIE